jgi:death on curing protein
VTRFLTLGEVLRLHRLCAAQTGGAVGVRDLGMLESALAQPHASFEGQSLYPTLIAKAAALGFSIIGNHPFLDGNKRTGHAAMEVFLQLNGWQISAAVVESEKVILAVAAGSVSRNELERWLEEHSAPL